MQVRCDRLAVHEGLRGLHERRERGEHSEWHDAVLRRIPACVRVTQYHKHDRLDDVPERAAIGCDWAYAVRRYNGSGVNSFWYQAELLLKVKGNGG